MSQEISRGVDTNTTPLHDSQYDVEVYPGHCQNAVMDILVPAHGHVDLTMNCLKFLYMYTQTPFHVIILDDAPPDDLGMTAQYIRHLQTKRNNITYCHSNIHWKCGNTFFNMGLKCCKTDYVVTVMNSVSVEPAWETVGLHLMKQDPQIGTVGFKCLFPNGLIESAGIVFMGHLPTDYGRDEPGYRCNEIREVPCVQWAFALHRKQALVGNLPEDVFNGHVGWDDIDNNMILKSKGWKIIYCGQGTGIHQPRATRGSNSVEAFRMNQQNAHIFFKRWGLWETYLEASNMNVAEILKPETKDVLGMAVTRIQVLQQLVREHEATIQKLVGEAMKELQVSPEQYMLEMNPQKNTWILKPNVKAIVERQALVTPIKPASDTEPAMEIKQEMITSAVG